VIREAMTRKNMVGLGKVVISRPERIVMVEPLDQRLMATTLRYAYEVRDAKEDIPPLKLPDKMVKLAEHILETKAGHFDASEFEDRYDTAVVDMLKQGGMPIERQPEAAAPTNVVNLMDTLRRSVEEVKPAAARGKAGERKRRKRRSADRRREHGRRVRRRTAISRSSDDPAVHLAGGWRPSSRVVD